MDNNEQVTIKDQVLPPQNTSPVVPPPPSGESKKMVIWLLGGLVLIILVVGGLYYFLSRQQNVASTSATITQQPVAQTQTPPDNTPDALDRDLNALSVANTDSDFTSIDQDLQNL